MTAPLIPFAFSKDELEALRDAIRYCYSDLTALDETTDQQSKHWANFLSVARKIGVEVTLGGPMVGQGQPGQCLLCCGMRACNDRCCGVSGHLNMDSSFHHLCSLHNAERESLHHSKPPDILFFGYTVEQLREIIAEHEAKPSERYRNAKKNLDFGDALKWLKQGSGVCRAKWYGIWYLEYYAPDSTDLPTSHGAIMLNQYPAMRGASSRDVWSPRVEDLFATDWEVIG